MTTYETVFNDAEWSMIVGMPQSVVSAASAMDKNSTRKTLIEGEAGLSAIADGRQSGSPLVEAVAVELVFRLGGDPDLGEEPPVAIVPDDAAAYVADTLDRARQVTALLADKVDAGESGAYRHWLVTIANQVVEAVPSGGVFGIGGDQVTEAEGTFVHQLTEALAD